jgi:hypothetical protein
MTTHNKEKVDLERFWKLESLGIDTTEQNKCYGEYESIYQNSCIAYKNDENKYIA